MAVEMGTLVKGKSYKVKCIDEKKATTRIYEGDKQMHIMNEDGQIVEGELCAHFNSARGGNKWYPYGEYMVSAIEVTPKVKKAEDMVTCDRCSGTGILPWVAHVEGGRCFKCGGVGKL